MHHAPALHVGGGGRVTQVDGRRFGASDEMAERAPSYGDERLPLRFWDKVFVDPGSCCWIWTASRHLFGYGKFSVKRDDGTWHPVDAHRWAYKELVGQIPQGLVVDHLCDNPPCVNPAHFRIVTQRENILRGGSLSARRARMTHCPRGHEFAGENLGLERGGAKRICVTCRRMRQRRRTQRHKEAARDATRAGGGEG